MSSTNNTPVSRDLSTRILLEACKQQEEQHHAEIELTTVNRSRRTRHHSLINYSRKFSMVSDVIAFYEARYGVNPQPTAYNAAAIERDVLAAGLPYKMVSVIYRHAKTPAEVRAAIDAYNDQQADKRAKNAARLAEIKARQAVA